MQSLRNGGIISKDEYVGKTYEEAKKYAEEGNFITRVVEIDGIPQMIEVDVKQNRLNFRVNRDRVTDVFGG